MSSNCGVHTLPRDEVQIEVRLLFLRKSGTFCESSTRTANALAIISQCGRQNTACLKRLSLNKRKTKRGQFKTHIQHIMWEEKQTGAQTWTHTTDALSWECVSLQHTNTHKLHLHPPSNSLWVSGSVQLLQSGTCCNTISLLA